MADEKVRFPSSANVKVDKVGKPVERKAEPQAESKTVEAKKQKLIKVYYAGENHVVFPNGVHQLAKGLNHLPEDVLEDGKKQPLIASLIKSGKITFSEGKDSALAEK